MVNTKRAMKKVSKESLDLAYNTLGEARDIIERAIMTYGENAELDWEEHSYDDERTLYIVVSEPETDEEMKYRIASETMYEKTRLRKEEEEYIRLKEKFEK